MMEPINKKQRQRAFWKFTLLFILSVIPVCVAIYLYGKIDTAENNFLRTEYIKYKSVKTSDANVNAYYERILKQTDDLNMFLLEKEPNALENKEYGSIEVKIRTLEKELDQFQTDILSSNRAVGVDSLAHDMLRNQIANLRILNDIYKKADTRISRQNQELKDTKEQLTECKAKMN